MMTSLFKKVLKGLAVVPMLLSTSFAAVSVWDGSVDDSWYDASLQSYNLTSAAQLAGLAKLVDGGNNFSGKTVNLGVDVILNDTTDLDSESWVKKTTNLQWTPIGNNTTKFAGEFNGLGGTKNRKIVGLYIDNANNGFQGLFGFAENAKLVNVDLVNGFIRGFSSVGGLCGRASGTTSFDNVTIRDFDIQGQKRVGGLVGLASGTIQRVSVEASVAGTDSVGGVVGFTSSTIIGTKAYPASFKGSVSGTNFTGGFVGRTSAAVKNLQSESTVSGTASYIGGVVGYTSSTADSISHVGNVSGGDYVGGAIGYIRSVAKAVNQKYGDILGTRYVAGVIGKIDSTSSYLVAENTNVKATGSVVGGVLGYARRGVSYSHHRGGYVSGVDSVGGLIGKTYYVDVKNSSSKGNVSGKNVVGGLVGYHNSSYKIHKSYAEGDVVALGNYVGGLAGNGYMVDSSYHKGPVSGNNYVGGIAGYARSTLDSVYHREGNVTGKVNVGGLAGMGSAIQYSYSDAYVSGVDSVGGIVGVTSGAVKKVRALQSVRGYYSVGGLVGRLNGSLDSSYFVGDSVIHEHDANATSFVAGGLVGYSKGTIKNSDATTHVRGWANVGGIVGSTSAAVTNCKFKGSVKGSNWRVGGIVGISSSTVTDCHSVADVYSTNSDVGGVAGRAGGALRRVSATGNVTGLDSVGGIAGHLASTLDMGTYKGELVSGQNMVGGLAGFASDAIDSSSAEGSVKGSANRVGGAVGYTSSTISYVTSAGYVTGVDTVGGVAGYVASTVNKSSAVRSVVGRNAVGGLCGVSGAVTGSFFVGDSVTGRYRIGGLNGYVTGAIGSSYSTAHVRGTDDVGGLVGGTASGISGSYATGNVTGADYNGSISDGFDNIGGLVGYATAGTIATSFSSGDVYGTRNVGGLAGRFEGTTIKQTYANGNVIGNYYGDEEDEIGNYNIGGLVGYGKATITESYVSGIVSGIIAKPVYTGCFVGNMIGTSSVGTSYYDASVCQVGSAGVDNLGEKNPNVTVSGTPVKNTTEMLTTTTYSGWSTSIWKFPAGSYPILAYAANSFANAVVMADIDTYVFDGNAKNPAVTSVNVLGTELVKNTNYTVSYVNNVDAGAAMVKVCGAGSYTGCKILEFQILPAEVTPSIQPIASVVYNGKVLKPAIKVMVDESEVDPSLYSVTYFDNVNVGIATVNVELKKNYVGQASANFVISKAKAEIVTEPTASAVMFGKTLSTSELSDGKGNVDGEFAWLNPDVMPTYKNDGYAVVFMPSDSANYEVSDSRIIPLTVIEKYSLVVKNGESEITNMVVDRDYVYTLPEAAEKEHYTFVGWFDGDENLGVAGTKIIVEKHFVIDAIYEAEKFEISFKNGSVLLSTTSVSYNEMPSYDGIPTKESSDDCNYEFVGWSPELAPVTETQVYTAQFKCVDRVYEIVFVNGKDTLQNEMLAHGAVPFYKGAIPTKASTAEYSYEFAGWSPEIVAVDGAATYVATFKEVARTYVISTSSNDETMGLVYGGGNFKYGDEVRLLAFANAGYEFSNWEDDVSAAMNRVVTVAGNAEYKAVFKKIEDKLSSSFEGTSSSSDKLSSSSEGISSSSDEQLASSSSVIPSSSSVIPSEGEGSSSSAKSSSSVKNESSSSSVTSSSSSAKSSSSSNKSSSSSAKSSSSSNKSSSSSAKSSSSSGKSSSSSAKSSSSSSDKTGFGAITIAGFSVETGHRSISIVGAAVGAKVHVMDMQGRVMYSARAEKANFTISLNRNGSYIVRVGNQSRLVNIK